MISKELLSEVFTDGQQDFEVIGIYPEDERLLEYVWIQELPDYSGDGFKRVPMKINIHELAHKCKEWAYEQDYIVCSEKLRIGGWGACVFAPDNNTCYPTISAPFNADTEPEAIFNACEWVLENMTKDNK